MFDDLSTESLADEVCSQAAHVAAGTCRFVLLAAELDRREGWGAYGTRSCAHWLNWRCGIALGAAREHLRVGHALASLPGVLTGFSSGALSYSKVRALTRVATAANEEELVELAGWATAGQLEAICRAYRSAVSQEAETRAAVEQHRRRSVRSWTNAEGQVVIYAELPPEEGAAVLASLDAMANALEPFRDVPAETPGDVPAETGGDVPTETPHVLPTAEPRCVEGDQHFHQRRADALVAMAEAALASGEPPIVSPDRYRVVVHVDRRVLEDPGAAGSCHIEGGGALAPATVRRLACCGEVVEIIHGVEDGSLFAGTTRKVPTRLRRLLQVRDGRCRFPGCSSLLRLDAHHVVFWTDGGPTTLDNLVLLCRTHHRLVHEEGFGIAVTLQGEVRAWTPDGTPLPEAPPVALASERSLVERHELEGLDISAGTIAFGGEPFDLGLTVDALLGLDRASCA
jgi:hypothetical protein